MASVNSYLLSSQVSRLLRGSESCSSGPSDREASLAVHFLPHQLSAETEPERQPRDTHWLLGEMFFQLFFFKAKHKTQLFVSKVDILIL